MTVRLAAAVAVAALLVAGLAATVVVRAGSGQGPTPAEDRRAQAAAQRFLAAYVEPSGRVVRRDQDESTVSEGQAYGLLLAVVTADRRRFDAILSWTQDHLQRPDGLQSWLYSDGRVQDPQPATDADVDTARALLLAARRFEDPGYLREAQRIARSIIAQESTVLDGRRLLVAGPWARARRILNPSYLAPRTFTLLAQVGGPDGPSLQALADDGGDLVADVGQVAPFLIPDWATTDPAGRVRPTGPPLDPLGAPRFGLDAQRLVIRFAESCRLSDVILVANMWPFLRDVSTVGDPVLAYGLDGQPLSRETNPLTLVAAAAAAGAAGDPVRREQLLHRAEAMDAANPTYYGSAWVALGRAFLTTDLLGSACDNAVPGGS